MFTCYLKPSVKKKKKYTSFVVMYEWNVFQTDTDALLIPTQNSRYARQQQCSW